MVKLLKLNNPDWEYFIVISTKMPFQVKARRCYGVLLDPSLPREYQFWWPSHVKVMIYTIKCILNNVRTLRLCPVSCNCASVNIIHILKSYFTYTRPIIRLPRCRRRNPEIYWSKLITEIHYTHWQYNHSKNITKHYACFLGISVSACCVTH